jgi:hypothetical protein
VRLGNPAWAQSPELLRADAVEARVDIGQLLLDHGRLRHTEQALHPVAERAHR